MSSGFLNLYVPHGCTSAFAHEPSSTYGHRDGNQAITDQGFISLDTQVHTHSCIILGQTDTKCLE